MTSENANHAATGGPGELLIASAGTSAAAGLRETTPAVSPAGNIKAEKRPHLENLDVLRGFAILIVVLFHGVDSVWRGNSFPFRDGVRQITFDLTSGTAFWLYPFHLGYLGVAMFFAVSGFCIHLSVASSSNPTPGFQFFLRRFFRIVPAYFAVLFLLAAQRVHWNDMVTVKDFLLHLTFLHNFDARYFYGLNPSFWSLAVEAQLYLLYPLLWLLARRAGWKNALLLTVVIELALRTAQIVVKAVYDHPLPVFVTGSPFYYWFSWAAGAYAAENYLRNQRLTNTTTLGCCLILIGFASDYWTFSSDLCFTLVAAGTAFLLVGKWSVPEPLRKWLILLGAWSYSLYLIHQPFEQKVGTLITESTPLPKMVALGAVWLTGALLIPVAALLFRTIEQPFIRIGHSFKKKFSPAKAT